MRHRKAGRKLGRNPSHRKALLRNMAKALIINTRITTTEAKAKTLRGVVEPLITLALKNDVHARRQAYQILGDHKLVQRLFDEIGPLFKAGGGGYTRVVKLAIPRKGDAAPLAMIEFTHKIGEAATQGAPAKKAKAVKKAASVTTKSGKVELEVKGGKVKVASVKAGVPPEPKVVAAAPAAQAEEAAAPAAQPEAQEAQNAASGEAPKP